MSTTSTNFRNVVFVYRYGVSVDVKVDDYVRRIPAEDIGLCEKFFVDRRDHAESQVIREESEICRAILNKARTCKGFIKEASNHQKNGEHFLTLRFEFENKEKFDSFTREFLLTLQTAVIYPGVTIKDRVFLNGYEAYVDVKMAKWVRGVPTDSLWAAERHFIVQRDYAKTEEDKRMYDTCRATVKWASTCGATLIGVCNHVIIAREGSFLRFDLLFNDRYFFDEFEDNLVVNVKGAVM